MYKHDVPHIYMNTSRHCKTVALDRQGTVECGYVFTYLYFMCACIGVHKYIYIYIHTHIYIYTYI